MNKKGFMFIETIVTLTILMALLISIYAVFINLLQKEKIVAEYDKLGDKYALFYIKEKNKGYFDNSTNYNKGNLGVSSFTGYDQFGLNKIIMLKCGSSYSNMTNTSGMSKDLVDYVKNVDLCPSGSDPNKTIRIIGEFKVGNKYSYAHIVYPHIND